MLEGATMEVRWVPPSNLPLGPLTPGPSACSRRRGGVLPLVRDPLDELDRLALRFSAGGGFVVHFVADAGEHAGADVLVAGISKTVCYVVGAFAVVGNWVLVAGKD
jgi:hypothetical protein